MRESVIFEAGDLMPEPWARMLGHGPVWTFNPGLLRDGPGWIMACRIVGSDRLRRIALCRLDADFRVIAGSPAPFSDRVAFRDDGVLPERARTWFADPRLVRIGDRAYITWNSGWHEPRNYQFLQEFDPASLLPVGRAREMLLEGRRQPLEKNWMLFGGGPAFAVYSVNPHRILSFSLEGEGDVLFSEAASRAWDPGGYAGRHGELRGGAPPQRVGGEYVSICHSALQTADGVRYAAAVYRFGADFPFAPTGAPAERLALPNPFGAGSALERLNPAVCEVIYPCGAAHDGGRWIVSYGINDERCAIAVIPSLGGDRPPS